MKYSIHNCTSYKTSALLNHSLEACRSGFILCPFTLNRTTAELPRLDLAHGDRSLRLLATALHILSILTLLRLAAPEPFGLWSGGWTNGSVSLPFPLFSCASTLPASQFIVALCIGSLLSCFPVVLGWIDAGLPLAKNIREVRWQSWPRCQTCVRS